LKEYKIGQKVWLIRSYAPAEYTDWKILDDFTVGQIGFEPKKDTVFIFSSQNGDYKRRIELGVILEKH
jgi:hypothetical protein